MTKLVAPVTGFEAGSSVPNVLMTDKTYSICFALKSGPLIQLMLVSIRRPAPGKLA